MELSSNEKITKMLQKYQQHVQFREKHKSPFALEELRGLDIKPALECDGVFVPPKPPIVKGYLRKIGSLLGFKNRRFFVLDPIAGTFTKYKDMFTCPTRPKDTYPLVQLRSVKRLAMTGKQRYCYFEVGDSASRVVHLQTQAQLLLRH